MPGKRKEKGALPAMVTGWHWLGERVRRFKKEAAKEIPKQRTKPTLPTLATVLAYVQIQFRLLSYSPISYLGKKGKGKKGLTS